MITFKKATAQHFLSVSRPAIEYDFTKHKLSLIQGPNGSGKSIIIDVIVYALFGKPFRKINLPALPNTLTKKKMLVTLEFSIGDTNYLIERGMKPNVFKIYRNGKLIDPPVSPKDYQKMLEQTILKFNYKSFTQIVILGSSSYIPFMELKAQERREVVEDLLDISIFSVMRTINKTKHQESSERLTKLKTEGRLASSKRKILIEQKEKIESMSQERIDNLKNRKDDIVRENLKLNSDLIEMGKRLENVYEVYSQQENLNGRERTTHAHKTTLLGKLQDIDGIIKFFEDNKVCPTCGSEIEDNNKKQKIEEHEIERSRTKLIIKDVEETLGQCKDEMEIIIKQLAEFEELRKESLVIEQQIVHKNKEIENIENEIKSLETEEFDVSEIQSVEERLRVLRNEYNEELSMNYVYNDIAKILKDDGAKKQIIDQYLPVLNSFIKKNLEILEYNVGFEFDAEFKEIIKSRGRDTFSYHSFSEGQKLRINLAIMFAFRELAGLKNSLKTNLLFMDEADGGVLDEPGFNGMMKLIKSQADYANTFLISWGNDAIVSKVDNVITAKMQGRYTQIDGSS